MKNNLFVRLAICAALVAVFACAAALEQEQAEKPEPIPYRVQCEYVGRVALRFAIFSCRDTETDSCYLVFNGDGTAAVDVPCKKGATR